MKKTLAVICMVVLVGILAPRAFAHCQVPCGIYDDKARFSSMLEDVATLKKAVKAINQPEKADGKSKNQLVRWVNTKETYADNISKTVTYYFLAQRIKTGQKNYEKKLVALHRIIVLAMKTKQGADLKVVDELGKAILAFKLLYFAR
jgi:nickel superoxide dismutase